MAMENLEELCRICSDELQSDGIAIFSPECMEKLVGEKIKRYLYFSVSISDNLPKKVCDMCLKKLDNIHRFAKMAAEMQEKFRMLLAQKEMASKPKIKLRSMLELKEEEKDTNETSQTSQGPPEENSEVVHDNGSLEEQSENSEDMELSFDVAVEEVGEFEARATDSADTFSLTSDKPVVKKENVEVDGPDEVVSDDERTASLLHSLLVKGKLTSALEIDHDYPLMIKEEPIIKDEPPDPEDEDIAEEIEEDRLNQIIKDELGSDSDEEVDSDVEITEMEVKVDPMLFFSNTSQTAIDVDQDSQSQDGLNSSNGQKKKPILTATKTNFKNRLSNSTASSSSQQPSQQMTRSQQRSNPVIASLKLGKPYKCTVCPRSFITDIGLQNHLWSHLPKKKGGPGQAAMVHKNVDLEDSQVYSSNGVLHTAQPSENVHLLKYVCPICGKKISTKGNLKVHLETHRPKGKYGCDICGRVFKTASNLYRHKDYHGGVQFPCNECGRVYPTNSTLRAHSITHSDLRPHKCPLCSKTFKRNQDLKFHINQHTGARPYQCPYCPKAFASSGNCFSHRKRMHPMEVERDKERAAEIMG